MAREYKRQLLDITTDWQSACQMYNVLLSKWQHGLISRSDLEEELRTKIRPVFFYEPFHGATNSSSYFMNGLSLLDGSALETTLTDYWNISAKEPEEFNDDVRWTETDEYGQWEPGRWAPDGVTWIPAGYSGMIHVDGSLPTEVVCNGDQRADAYLYKESGQEREGADATWMVDFNYDLPGTKADWSAQINSGKYGQPIDLQKMDNLAVCVFGNSTMAGETLWDTMFYRRDNDVYITNNDNRIDASTGIVNIFDGVDPILYLTYNEEYLDDGGLSLSRLYEPWQYHPLLLTPTDKVFPETETRPFRDKVIYPKELWFRVERLGNRDMLFLCFSKVLYTNIHAEFHRVDTAYYSDLMSGGYWRDNYDISPPYHVLNINAVSNEPHWQLAGGFLYRARDYRVFDDMKRTHIFSTYHEYDPGVGQPRWQSNTSDLLRLSLSHTVSNFVDYSDFRYRGQPLYVGGIRIADNTETEMYASGHETDNDNISMFVSSPAAITDSLTLYMPVLDEKTGTLTLQIDAGGKERTIPLYIHDQTVDSGLLLSILGGVGEQIGSKELFVYDDTTLENFVNDNEWGQWPSDSIEQAKWDGQYTYTKFDATITHSTYPPNLPHFYKDFGTDYFGREFVVEFEYVFRDQGANQAEFCPFIIGDTTRYPSTFSVGDQAMYIKCDTNGLHTLERANTGDSEEIGSLVDGTRYYVKIQYGPITPYGQSSQFVAFEVLFYPTASRTGIPAFSAYHRMDDKSYIEKFDQLAIGAAMSSGTYSFILENLWIEGSAYTNNTSLYIPGHLPTNDSLKLRTEGLAYPSNSFVEMMVFGGTLSGSYWKIASQPLFLYFDTTETFNIPLVMFNNESPPSSNDDLPLFIGGVYKTANNNVPLFIDASGVADNVPLYTYGAGTFPGYVSLKDDLQCYVHRPDQSAMQPLLVYNDTPGINTFMNMRINGILGDQTQSCTLVMPNVKDGTPNSFLKLQLTGGVQVVSEATLAMPETLANLNANQPLICYHSGGAPNSFVTAVIDGVYKSTGYVMLSMPEVTHIPTLNAPLYIRGY